MAVQTVQNLPAQFIQDIGKDLATQITAQSAIPVVAPGTGGITQLAGETADQFAARQKLLNNLILDNKALLDLHHKLQAKTHYKHKHKL